jgi:hypothetical protein
VDDLLSYKMSKQNNMNINTVIQQFMSNDCGYIKAPENEIQDSFKAWGTPKGLEDVRLERDIAFLDELTDMYDKVGPKEWVGRTVPLYVPVDAEVGDDHIQLSDSPLLFVAEVVTAKDTCSINVSEKDTFVSSRYGNYSENYILKPDNISELSFPNMKAGQDSIFLDIAKIRTVIPVCSMRQKHSDTIDGKVTLLGKQGIYQTELCGYEIKLAMCIQQFSLGLMKERKFPYAPTFLGGYGSPPIFDNVQSMIRCFEAYRSGEYYNLLAAICLAVFETERNGRESSKAFLTSVKGSAEAWQDWYKVYTKYTPQIKGGLDPSIYNDQNFLGTLGKNEIWDSAANRLLSANFVCSKTQLLVHDHMEDLTKILLSPYCSLRTREVIELEKRAQRQESVFNPQLMRELVFDQPLFLEDELVDSLLNLSRGANYHLKAMLSSDEIFTLDSLDAIKQRSPTIVNIQMSTKRGLRYPLKFDSSVREDELPYYESLLDFIKGQKSVAEVSRVLVEDDPILIEIAREWAIETSMKPLSAINVMVITTDDVALCKKINLVTPQIVVFRISAKRSKESILRVKDSLKATYKFADLRFYDDEGSIAAANASTALIQKGKAGWQRVKFVLGKAIQPSKTSHRRLNEVRVIELIIQPDGKFDQQGLLSGRYNPPRVYQKRTLSKFGNLEEEYSFDDFDD